MGRPELNYTGQLEARRAGSKRKRSSWKKGERKSAGYHLIALKQQKKRPCYTAFWGERKA